MGRTVSETVRHTPGTHHLITTKAHDGTEVFDKVIEVGGSLETFPARRGLSKMLADLQPDLIHMHGGALSPLLMVGTAIRRYPAILTMYAWPVMPPIRDLRRAGWRAALASNVLKPRVLATSALSTRLLVRALRRTNIKAILSPDPSVIARLEGKVGIPVLTLNSGAVTTSHRASFANVRPEVVFAGRAETVRGIDTLIDAFPTVLRHVPDARLRLLLMPRPELPQILDRVAAAGLSQHVDVRIDPVPDLLAELANGQVGCWPFKFDYTTSPPAMALTEAMSVGLPVVATNVACVRSAVQDGQGARLVPTMEPELLAAEIIILLTDQVEWHRQSKLARSNSASRTWSRAAETSQVAYAQADPDFVAVALPDAGAQEKLLTLVSSS
jgi:starch synthase